MAQAPHPVALLLQEPQAETITLLSREKYLSTQGRAIFSLRVWPLLAYSNAARQAYASPVHLVNSLPPKIFNLHISVPCMQQGPKPSYLHIPKA